MCGVIGGLLQRQAQPERLDRALESLHHRGPDAVGKWISSDGRWFLGHTRLSIIGLSNGDQPMVDASGGIHVVVNGEFYGYKAIRTAAQKVAFSKRIPTARSHCICMCVTA